MVSRGNQDWGGVGTGMPSELDYRGKCLKHMPSRCLGKTESFAAISCIHLSLILYYIIRDKRLIFTFTLFLRMYLFLFCWDGH